MEFALILNQLMDDSLNAKFNLSLCSFSVLIFFQCLVYGKYEIKKDKLSNLHKLKTVYVNFILFILKAKRKFISTYKKLTLG